MTAHLQFARAALLVAVLLSFGARAEPALFDRALDVADSCDLDIDVSALKQVNNEEQSSLARFVARLETTVYDDEDCERAEVDLREGIAAYEALERGRPAVDAQQTVQHILARPEFQETLPAPDTTPNDEPGWFERFLKMLWEFFTQQPKREAPEVSLATDGGMAGANVVMVVAVLAVFGLVAFIASRYLKDTSSPRDATGTEQSLEGETLSHQAMSALAKPAETWASLADELAARGQYREAIRHLYLALLARLHRDGVIDYDPTLSNWEYLFAFRGASVVKAAFRDLTRRFDFAWYGHEGVDALAYALFREGAAPLLAQDVTAGGTARA